MVVLAALVLNDCAGFCQGQELLPVEALVAQASMETLDEAILSRTAGLDMVSPVLQPVGDKSIDHRWFALTALSAGPRSFLIGCFQPRAFRLTRVVMMVLFNAKGRESACVCAMYSCLDRLELFFDQIGREGFSARTEPGSPRVRWD